MPLTPTISVTCGRSLDSDRSIDGVENGADLLLHQIAEALAAARACFHGADDPIRRRDTNVRRDQQLLERIDRIDIDRSRSALGLIRATDDFVKPVDDLLFGTGETLADSAEDAHSFDITAFTTKDTKDTKEPLSQQTALVSMVSLVSKRRNQWEALGCDSASWRCGRSISISTAVRTSERPSSTAAIWVAIGSSTP